MASLKYMQENHKKFQADLLVIFEKQDELVKLVKQCVENCDNLAKATRKDMATMTQSLKNVLEEDAMVQERFKTHDEKIENLELELTKVDSYQTNTELREVKSQIAVMSVSLNSIRSEMEELLVMKEALHNDTATIEKSWNSGPLAAIPQVGPVFPSVHDICNELKQRERKQNNLVVFGLNECNRDAEIIQELVTTVGILSEVNSTFRIGKEMEGKPRPLVICFATKQGRDQLYSNLRNLRGRDKWNKVSVVPDLTKLQYMEERKIYQQLLEEVTKKNEESEEGDGLWKVVGKRGTKRIVKHPREMSLRPFHPGESLLQ